MNTRTKQKPLGFVEFSEQGSRITLNRPQGLQSVDLGCISFAEAKAKALLYHVPFYVKGRPASALA